MMEDAITTMLDVDVYLEKLTLFASILRADGFEISPKETEDAALILLELGMDDRKSVKNALMTVYAKSRDEQLRFSRIFDSFFLSEDAIHALDKKHMEEELKRQQAIKEAEEKLKENNPGGQYSEEETEAYSQLSESEKERLENLKNHFSSRSKQSDKLYNEFIHTIFMKSILEQQMMMEDAATGLEMVDPEVGLMFKDISDFQDTEIPKAVMYIKSLAAQINGEFSKRRNKLAENGALDFRKTIRKGLSTGGSFYHLSFKRPGKKKKRLILLCDVSGSMIRFSEFALRLMQALNQATDSSRVILFSEESKEADPFHLQNMDLFREYVKESGVYGRGTNLGACLKKLNDERPSALSPSTVLIILSDVKSIDMASALYEIDRARARAGKVFCLNPIPRNKWKYSQSIVSVSEKCTMLSCSTLNELGSACRKLTNV